MRDGAVALEKDDLIDRLEPRDQPEASDETWEHRIQTRHRNLQVRKSTREYQKFLEARDHFKDHHDIMEPLTPNLFDRSVSKRSWKYQVMQWRLALQDWYLENSVSVASTTNVRIPRRLQRARVAPLLGRTTISF